MCQNIKKDFKMSKRCQIVKKMSHVKKSNSWTREEVHKNNLTQWGSHTYESHQNWLKTYFMNILRIFDDHCLATIQRILLGFSLQLDDNRFKINYIEKCVYTELLLNHPIFFCRRHWNTQVLINHQLWKSVYSGGSRISQTGGRQPQRGGANILFDQFFPKTAWKWRKFDPEGGARVPVPPPLDPPMVYHIIYCWNHLSYKCEAWNGDQSLFTKNDSLPNL